MGRTRRTLAPKWQYVGLGALAVAAAATVGFAFLQPANDSPVSEKVSSAYATGTAAPTLTPPPVLPNVVFLGDSYIAGSSMDAGIQFPDIIAGTKGWNQIMLGEGGSGYITKGNKGTTFGDRVQAAVDSRPAMVVVSGGFNDKDAESLPVAVADTLTRLRDSLPGVPIVVPSNFVPSEQATPAQSHKHDVIVAAATETGSTLIDVTGMFAGHTDMLGEDKVHPTAVGHEFIAEQLMTRLPEPKRS